MDDRSRERARRRSRSRVRLGTLRRWPSHGHGDDGHAGRRRRRDQRLYDLEPIRLNYLNDKLGLDAAEADRNSPPRHLPSSAAPLVVTVGLGELPELVRQSQEFADAWRRRGLRGSYLPVARHDHFSILEELAQPDGAILRALKELSR